MKEKPSSDAEMRQQMIDNELEYFLKQVMETEQLEDEDEMEIESVEALKKAANKKCYLKKFYDISQDKIVYFPSVAKTIVNYELMEEAEKYYYEEEDEFPMDYSIALREVAFAKMEAEGGGNDDDNGFDDEMMQRLSMNMVLTEADKEELKKAMEEIEEDQENSDVVIDSITEEDEEELQKEYIDVPEQQDEAMEIDVVGDMEGMVGDTCDEVVGDTRDTVVGDMGDSSSSDEDIVGENDSASEFSSSSSDDDDDGDDDDDSATPEGDPFLLLLVRRKNYNSGETNQDLIINWLQAQGVTPTLLDGADPQNKERRDELFDISCIRAKYPQLFLVYGSETLFIGDFETIKGLHASGMLTRQELFSIVMPTPEKVPKPKSKPKSSRSKTAPLPLTEISFVEEEDEEEAITRKTESQAPSEDAKIFLLLLISSIAGNRKWVANTDYVISMLQAKGMTPAVLDGADPKNKDRREKLFELSGIRAQYPQLFLVHMDSDTLFIGDFDTVQDLNDCGMLTQQELFGLVESPTKSEPTANDPAEPVKEEVSPIKPRTLQSITSEDQPTHPVYDSDSDKSDEELCCWLVDPCWLFRGASSRQTRNKHEKQKLL